MSKIGDVNIIGIEVELTGVRDSEKDYDFGALYLKLEDREYILDTVQTYWTESDDKQLTTIECVLEKDDGDVFECEYDLDEIDLIDPNLDASFYVGGNFENEVKKITLFVDYDNTQIEINVKED